MNVDPNRAAAKVEYAGKTYYFCAPGCAKRFQQAPEKYVGNLKQRIAPPELVNLGGAAPSGRTGTAVAPAREGAEHSAHHDSASHHAADKTDSSDRSVKRISETESPRHVRWTCPMHPQIVRDRPGSCPICGMALEPMGGEVEDDHELRDMSRRLAASAALVLPLLILEMGGMLAGGVHGAGAGRRAWLLFLLATPVCTWGAWPFYIRAVESIRNRSLNMFTLIGLGVFTSYTLSALAVLA